MRRLALLLLLLTALGAACGSDQSSGPSLTYPGPEGHARWFPLVGTAHDVTAPGTTVTCELCHTDPATFGTFDCTGCHTPTEMNPIHTGVDGYGSTTADCMRCHQDGRVAAPPGHDTRSFPRGAGSDHAGIGCRSCHTNLGAPRDPANFACASCHAGLPGFAGSHDPQGGIAILTVFTNCPRSSTGTTLSLGDSASCLRCHADSQVLRVASHPRDEGTPAGQSGHRNAGCVTCHAGFRSDKPFAASFGSARCATCHYSGSACGNED